MYSQLINTCEYRLKEKNKNINRLKELAKFNLEFKKHNDVLVDVLRVLSTISDDNLNATLDYITDVINKALSEIFKNDTHKVSLDKNLYAGKHSHINLELTVGNGEKRDIALQTGTGLAEVISFLYTICMIEVQGGSKLVVMDEILANVHPKARQVILDMMDIFVEGGFQFIMVEHGVNNYGKMYLVENIGGNASVSHIESYNDEIYSSEIIRE